MYCLQLWGGCMYSLHFPSLLFLSHPQRYARWVEAELADHMLQDMHLQEVGEVIMPDAPQPPGIRITMLGVPVLLPVLVTPRPLSTTSMVTKVS